MTKIIKPENLEYDNKVSPLEPFNLLTLSPRLSRNVNSKHLVFDLRRLEPGKYSFPYHFHRNAEELMVIISGSMTIRTPEGLKIAEQGHIIFCEMGEAGAHQFYNHGTVTCEYLDIRTVVGIDIAEYPDSGKIGILPYRDFYEKDGQVDYFQREENVQQIWDKLRNE